jgi:hypothetical protein
MAGFIKQLFRKAPIPKSADAKELVDLACNLLTAQIRLGSALPGGANRQRLEMPYARGYVFGFVDALMRTKGIITEEKRILALISVIHAKVFGKAMGSVFMVDARSSHSPHSAFTKGRATGETDLERWVADSDGAPTMLCDYLNSRGPLG